VFPDAAEPDVGAFPDGDDGAFPDEETGADSTGDVVGVVHVWVGSTGDATGVELGFVVPAVAGPDVGAFPDGEETGADPTGDEVGVVDVCVVFMGDATGDAGPVGGPEVGCGEAGVGVRIGG